jgi:hypothetical protein
MSLRPHPRRARVDPSNLVAWATCDGCGFEVSHDLLRWQYEYAGPGLINTRVLRCPLCINKPNPTLRTIVLPPDPDPLLNARPEPYAIDESPITRLTAGRRAVRVILQPPRPRGAIRIINANPTLLTSP